LLQCLEDNKCTLDEEFHGNLDRLTSFTSSTVLCLKGLINSSSSSRDISSLSSKPEKKKNYSIANKFNITDTKPKKGSTTGARILKKKRSADTQIIANAFLEDPNAIIETQVVSSNKNKRKSKPISTVSADSIDTTFLLKDQGVGKKRRKISITAVDSSSSNSSSSSICSLPSSDSSSTVASSLPTADCISSSSATI